jgi:hypothetical protein
VTFEAWLGRLRLDGYLICPASTALPVELRAVRPDGWGIHLRCRGVHVRLGLYRPGRAAWQVPLRDRYAIPEESLELWEHRPLRQATADVTPAGTALPAGTRIAFTGDHETPDHQVVFDGSRERGWRGYEAGLLRAGGAAEIFTALLTSADAQLTGQEHPVSPAGAAGPASPVPAGSRGVGAGAIPAARGPRVHDLAV